MLAGIPTQKNGNRPVELYCTRFGKAIVTLAEDYLSCMDEGSVDLVITSPPFALLRRKPMVTEEQR